MALQIKELRKEKSWSQALLAEASGLSLRTIQRLEKKGYGAPETLLAIAGAFDVDVTEFTKKMTGVQEENRAQFLLGINFSNYSIAIRLTSWFIKRKQTGQKLMAVLGTVLLFAPSTFILTNVIRYTLGFEAFPNLFELFYQNENWNRLFNNVWPVLFFIGLSFGSIINIIPFFDVEISLGRRNSVNLNYTGTWQNTSIWISGILGFCVMLLYALAENGIVMFGL